MLYGTRALEVGSDDSASSMERPKSLSVLSLTFRLFRCFSSACFLARGTSIILHSTRQPLRVALVTAFASESYFRENRGPSDLNPTSANVLPSQPPLPRLTLRVGVTGHRPDRLVSSDVVTIRHQIETVLRLIKDTVIEASAKVLSVYQPDMPVLRLVSALAEGSDRLVAQAGLDLGYEIQAVLPFQRVDYLKDFETETSRQEFDDLIKQATAVIELDGVHLAHGDGQPYAACGRVILDHCDVLIAIWNGEEGRRGGTADVVREAARQGVTIIWIDARAPYGIRFGIGSRYDVAGSFAEVTGLLRRRIEDVITAPNGAATDGPALQYFSERVVRWSPTIVWKAFLVIVGASGLRVWSTDTSDSELHERHTPHLAEFDEPHAAAVLERAYFCADALANHYASTYRSAFLLNYLMAATAVFFAFVGYVAETTPSQSDLSSVRLSVIAGLIEFALIGAILAIKIAGNRRRWHERWIDYRLLAEQLRQQTLLTLLGRVLPSGLLRQRSLSGSEAANSWVHWLLAAYTRSAGVIDAPFTSDYIINVSIRLAEALRIQIGYHRENAVRLRKVNRTIHRMGALLFSTAAIACSLHLLNFAGHLLDVHLFAHGGRISLLMTLLTVVGPAFGAALMAIRFQGEFERSIRRSQAMESQLTEILKDLDQRMIESGDFSSINLSEIAIATAELMVHDVLDWRTVFLARPLLLPS